MHKGSCLCGQVEYAVDGPIGPVIMCHCSRCRKAGGSAFATNGIVASGNFRFTKGEAGLRDYQLTDGRHRIFCGTCGSAILSRRDALPEIVRIRMGTLDTPFEGGPEMHIFVGSKADWETIPDDGLPRHHERPPAS